MVYLPCYIGIVEYQLIFGITFSLDYGYIFGLDVLPLVKYSQQALTAIDLYISVEV